MRGIDIEARFARLEDAVARIQWKLELVPNTPQVAWELGITPHTLDNCLAAIERSPDAFRQCKLDPKPPALYARHIELYGGNFAWVTWSEGSMKTLLDVLELLPRPRKSVNTQSSPQASFPHALWEYADGSDIKRQELSYFFAVFLRTTQDLSSNPKHELHRVPAYAWEFVRSAFPELARYDPALHPPAAPEPRHLWRAWVTAWNRILRRGYKPVRYDE